MMLGPEDAAVHTRQSMKWKLKRKSTTTFVNDYRLNRSTSVLELALPDRFEME
jgi:hypothetical protein